LSPTPNNRLILRLGGVNAFFSPLYLFYRSLYTSVVERLFPEDNPGHSLSSFPLLIGQSMGKYLQGKYHIGVPPAFLIPPLALFHLPTSDSPWHGADREASA
jgi:hypothetical protein